MNKITRIKLISALLVSCLLGACSTPAPSLNQGPGAEISFDGLYRVENAGWQNAWARPDFDISSYSRIMFTGSDIAFRPTRGGSRTASRLRNESEFAISQANRERLTEIVSEEFEKQLSQISGFELVESASENTLLIEISLLDVVSNVPPQSVQRSDIYLSEVGSATLSVELRDSQTGAILARVSDRRAAEQAPGELQYVNSVTAWAEVRQLAAHWGRLMRRRIEQMAAELRFDNPASGMRRPAVSPEA